MEPPFGWMVDTEDSYNRGVEFCICIDVFLTDSTKVMFGRSNCKPKIDRKYTEIQAGGLTKYSF